MKVLIVLHGKDRKRLADHLEKVASILNKNPDLELSDYLIFSESLLTEEDMVDITADSIYYKNKSSMNIEEIANDIYSLVNSNSHYDGIIIVDDAIANGLCVSVACKLRWQYQTGIVNADFCEERYTFERFIYNNNINEIIVVEAIKFVVCLGNVEKTYIKYGSGKCNQIIKIESDYKANYILESFAVSTKADKKISAVLLAVGKGIKSKEEVTRLRTMALNKGLMFGVTRPIAMNGWAPIDEIIGVSGMICNPKICITLGVSGSAAFYAGIQGSEYIISVNVDADANIIKMSDVSIVDDYANIVDSLINQI